MPIQRALKGVDNAIYSVFCWGLISMPSSRINQEIRAACNVNQLVSLGGRRHGVGPVEDFLEKLNATVADHASDFRYDAASDHEVNEIDCKDPEDSGAF